MISFFGVTLTSSALGPTCIRPFRHHFIILIGVRVVGVLGGTSPSGTDSIRQWFAVQQKKRELETIALLNMKRQFKRGRKKHLTKHGGYENFQRRGNSGSSSHQVDRFRAVYFLRFFFFLTDTRHA